MAPAIDELNIAVLPKQNVPETPASFGDGRGGIRSTPESTKHYGSRMILEMVIDGSFNAFFELFDTFELT